MKKLPSKLLAMLTALALAVSMAGAALAAPSADHVAITKPKAKAVYYIGETIPLAATLKEYRTEKYGTLTTFKLGLSNGKTGKTVWSQELGDSFVISPDGDVDSTPIPWNKNGKYKFSKSIKTAKLAAGSYTFKVYFFGRLEKNAAEIADENGDYSPSFTVSENVSVKLTLKQLKAPAKPWAKTGKKKVTISWKKATGAKKYEVYRSAKKKSGYKKIATVSKAKYVDKKAKKGKRYYYKVRTLRGSVKSACTSPVRSKKVK